MKKITAILTIFAMVLSLLSAASAQELIASDATAKDAMGNHWALRVYELINEYTNGELTVNYKGVSELGGDEAVLNFVQGGTIDFSVNQTAPVVAYVPELAVFDLPMLFVKYDAHKINEVLNGDNEFTGKLGKAYEAAGFHLLGFVQGATYRMTTSDKEIRTLEDFKGLKIRTMNNANHMAFWTAIGAEPTPLAWGEVYTSLQNGLIEAEENAADTCANSNFQEVQTYLACTNHILYCNQMCINKDVWDGLSDAHKEAIDRAVKQACEEFIDRAEPDYERPSVQKLIEGGMELITYPEEFYDSVLALEGVQALYTKIDADTNGLAGLLIAELNK